MEGNGKLTLDSTKRGKYGLWWKDMSEGIYTIEGGRGIAAAARVGTLLNDRDPVITI